MKLIGYPNKIRKTSELEKPTVSRSNSTKTKGTIIAYEKIDDTTWNPSGNWSNEEELDLNSKKTIYYVPIRNWRIIHNDSEYHNPRHLE